MKEHNYYRYKRKRSIAEKIQSFSTITWLIIVTSVISIVSFVLFNISEKYTNYFALKPANILAGKYFWTVLTHIFVHGGIAHLAINMFVLFSLGSLCERIIGKKRFIWFYLFAGIFAGLVSVLLSGLFGNSEIGARIFGSPDIFMVGASGAIFAIAGLYVILLPRIKFSIIFLPFFAFPGFIMIPLVLVVMWGLSIIGNWPIGNVAHFGGFLAGIIYGLYLRQKYKRKVLKLQKIFK